MNIFQNQSASTSGTHKPLLCALQGKKPAHTPLWLMRQAGRYLPEYRAIRENNNTLTMFKTPSIATEITLQPLRRFALDGAIVYADILLLPEALGLGLEFVKGEGPQFARTIRSAADLKWLENQAKNTQEVVAKTSYVAETLTRVHAALDPHVTLLGFAGAPWTVASYMIEGGSAKGEFFESKKLMFEAPSVLHGLLSVLTDLTIDYLHMQVDAGAEALQLFESWGGALTPDQYLQFCAPYSTRIMNALRPRVPTIHFVGEAAGILDEVLTVPSDAFGVDWRQSLKRVGTHSALGTRTLQGNLDPLLLHAPPELLKEKATQILEAGLALPKSQFVFNLGHGIRQTTPPENVGLLVDLVHQFKRPS